MWLNGNDAWSTPCFVQAVDGPGKWNHDPAEFPGVYRLVALNGHGSMTPLVCKRLCGDDESGTLYIGQSSYLHGRVSLLVRSTNPASPVQAYRKLPEILMRTFPVECLAVTWQRSGNTDLARSKEGNLLRNYVATFGELPPLNGQGASSIPD